jgi:predicted neuraminidase
MSYENNNYSQVGIVNKLLTILLLVAFIAIAWLILREQDRNKGHLCRLLSMTATDNCSAQYGFQLPVSLRDLQGRGNPALVNEPLFTSELIPNQQPSAHAATLEVLPNGNLIALWFAGSREGQPDVKIWQSVFDGKQWETPHFVVSPKIIEQDTKRYTKKVGNPVIYRAPNGTLHLFVVSVGVGGWSGSSLNHFMSNDNGNTWCTGERLILSPLFNISTLVRTNAITLTDGGFYLPVYHELIHTYPEVLRFDKNGRFISQIRLNFNNNLLQPAILPISDKVAYAYMRNKAKQDDILYYQSTNDAGITWSTPKPTNLINQDSSLAVAMLDKNKYLMVHNIARRDKLSLAISADGVSWTDIYLLDNTQDAEFSYPSIQVHDGVIDILYTWQRKHIKHVRFNQAWLNQQVGDFNAK